MNKFDFVAFFAGCGGSSLGLHNAGGKCRLAADYSEIACESHDKNFTNASAEHTNLEDWEAIDFSALFRKHGLNPKTWTGIISWTAPCQGYCRANEKLPGVDESLLRIIGKERLNMLTPMVVELARAVPNAFIILEQVPSFLGGTKTGKLKHKVHVEYLIEGLRRERGIEISAAQMKSEYILSSADYGVAQDRERLILPIPPRGMKLPRKPSATVKKCRTVWDEIGPRSQFAKIASRMPLPFNEYREFTESEARMYAFIRHGETIDKAAKRHPDKLNPFLSRWGEGKAYRTAWRKPCRVIMDLGQSSPTRIDNVHPQEQRFFSAGECLALSGFPPDYKLSGGLDDWYSQISGAVMPPVAEAVANAWVPEYQKFLRLS